MAKVLGRGPCQCAVLKQHRPCHSDTEAGRMEYARFFSLLLHALTI